MIENQNDITTYTPNGKIYLPSQFINSNYIYYFSPLNGYIRVVTDQNCSYSGSTPRCDAYNIYYNDNYAISLPYLYSRNSSGNDYLPYTSFTDDINYSSLVRNNFFQDKFIMFGMLIIALLFFISLRKGYRYK